MCAKAETGGRGGHQGSCVYAQGVCVCVCTRVYACARVRVNTYVYTYIHRYKTHTHVQSFNGKLLAGINAKIELFKLSESESGGKELTTECAHRGHIMVRFVDLYMRIVVCVCMGESLGLSTSM